MFHVEQLNDSTHKAYCLLRSKLRINCLFVNIDSPIDEIILGKRVDCFLFVL
jgi:hypothetical protein